MMSETDFTGANMAGAVLLRRFSRMRSSATPGWWRYPHLRHISFRPTYPGRTLPARTDQGHFSQDDASRRKSLEKQDAPGGISRGEGGNVDFSGADMHNSRILRARKCGGQLHEYAGRQGKLDEVGSVGKRFPGLHHRTGPAEGCDLTGCNFSGVKAKQARLTKSNLSDSDLTEMNLFQGSLRKSKLVGPISAERTFTGPILPYRCRRNKTRRGGPEDDKARQTGGPPSGAPEK